MRHRIPLLTSLLALLLTPCIASAQGGRSFPGPSYYVAIDSLYDGEYARSAKAFQREWRSAIRVGTTRWLDSVCIHAMRGEALYQLGQNREALQEFDAACELYLANHNWLLRVQFQQDPREDNNPRRLAPWGASMRKVTFGRLPQTMLIARGRVDNSDVANRGGVVDLARYWKVDAAEVVRCTALAIRRRNQLLGPLGPHDRLSRQLADTLARGGAAPANHWSGSWADLLTALAQMGVHKSQEAAPFLNRALLLGGRYEHKLTGAVLLAQAQLALATDNGEKVPLLAREAALAAYAYEDWDVLSQAFALGHVYFLGTGGKKIDETLPRAVEWADRQRADHISAMLRLLMAEEYAAGRQTSRAEKLLATAMPRRSDISIGRLAPYADYINAMIQFQKNKPEEGAKGVEEALARYAELSLTNFQLSLSDQRFDGGELSPRVAVGVYRILLTDPSPVHWALDPMDATATMRTDHEASFNRWIDAALSRREVLPAMYAADLAKRRRFLNHQPMGGRLAAMQRLLETPEAQLDVNQKQVRLTLLNHNPDYLPLATKAADTLRDLAGAKGLFSEETQRRDGAWLKQLEGLTADRETLLQELALRRVPVEIDFPPRRSAEDTRKRLAKGDVLLVFHQSGDALYGFVLVESGEHVWRLPNAGVVQKKIGDLLRGIGNHTNSKNLSHKDLTKNAWRKNAAELGDLLLGDSRIDLALTKRLVVVPDGPLWHLPLEAIEYGEAGQEQLIFDAAPLRYAPTMALAFGDDNAFRPVRQTGVAMPRPASAGDDREAQQTAWKQMSQAEPTVVRLPNPSPVSSPLVAAALDSVVVTVETSIDPKEPYQWSPLPIDRNEKTGTLAGWLKLPLEGPQRVILSGLHTAAENGLKGSSRRSSRKGAGPAVGSEMFHAACGLMAAGGRSILLSRWQTNGATHRKLIQEMVVGWSSSTAPEAWRRSVSLARSSRLDPFLEPRYRPGKNVETDEAVTADHPFFWAGYLLLDTGYEPPSEEEEAEALNE